MLRRKNFLGTKEKVMYSQITGQIFYREIKVVNYVLKIMFMFMLNNYIYVNRQTYV